MNIDRAIGLAVPLVFPTEGCRLRAYLDILAKPPVWTIGHGTTQIDGKPVRAGMTCTPAQADAWAVAHLREAAAHVQRVVEVPLSDHQLAALTSLCYNIGSGHFATSDVVRALNLSLYSAAADRILEYDHAGGVEIAGLTTRRGLERRLFLTPDDTMPALEPEVDATADLNQRELDRIARSGDA
jgi:lysozyme